MHRLKKIVSLCLLVLYVAYYSSTIFFYHTHIIDGKTTSHSHAHKESHHNSQSGGHTKQDIVFIAQISHFEFVDIACQITLAPQQFQLFENKLIEEPQRVVSIHFQNLSLRAPPAWA